MELAAGLILFWMIFGGAILLGSVFWIWMIIDVAINKRMDNAEKIVWVLIILFTHFLGSIIYFLVRWLPDRRKLSA